MSTLAGPPVRLRDALGSQLTDAARAVWVRLPAESQTVRDLAFAAYRRDVRRILRAGTERFEAIGTRTVAESSRSSIVEIELVTDARVHTGDMLYVWWRNDPERVAALDPALAATELGYWTTPLPHRPARRSRTAAGRLAEAVYDLSALSLDEVGALDARRLRALPRITPRLYTASHVSASPGGSSTVRLQVTMRGDWAQRAAAFLHRVQPGERLHAWVMPHPNRVERRSPGIAIVTGSGAAGVFAALRAGAEPIDLIWGLGDKRPGQWVLDELRAHERSGALSSLRLVSSPEHVAEALRARGGADELRERVRLGDRLYVSGNEAAGGSTHEALVEMLGEAAVREAAESLRYINSS